MRFIWIFSILIFGIVSTTSTQGQEVGDADLTEPITILDLSDKTGIPSKKLFEILKDNFLPDIKNNLTSLEIPPEMAIRAIEEFERVKLSYIGEIVLVGMFTVFTGLVLTAVFINLLAHANPSVKSVQPDLKETLSTDTVAAITAALFFHQNQRDSEDREGEELGLTWHRNASILWKSNRTMPNGEFFSLRYTGRRERGRR